MKATTTLTGTQQFVLNQFFTKYPEGLSFDEILNGYENQDSIEIVATDFWAESLLPEDMVIEVRSVESALRHQFFPAVEGDFDLMQNLWAKVHEHVTKSKPSTNNTVDWLSIRDNGRTLSAFNRPNLNLSRDDFMAWFRGDAINEELSVDDCIEVFRGALKGSSDFTIELFEQLFSDYEVSHLQVVDTSLNFDAISGIDYFKGKCYPYRMVEFEGFNYKLGSFSLSDAMQAFCNSGECEYCNMGVGVCETRALDNEYVYYTDTVELLTWSDKQLTDYVFENKVSKSKTL